MYALHHFALRDIEAMDAYLDANVAQEYKDQPLAQDWARVAKAIEENGEAIRALIGYTGQNPRKGVTFDRDDMLEEMADTALTMLFGIQHFTKDTNQTDYILARRLECLVTRVGLREVIPDAPTQ